MGQVVPLSSVISADRNQEVTGSGWQNPQRPHLPITPSILKTIRSLLNGCPARAKYVMPWAAVTLCFFGFFHTWEIDVPSQDVFDARTHLSWGDMAIDN